MNRTYSLVWNRRLKQWVVASELARSCGMPGSGRVRSGVAAALLALAIAGPAAAADLAPGALPTGGTVAAGQAAIATSGNRLDVTQGSQRAIINWQGFDIGSQAQVNFAQPNSSAVALNRVSGPTATRIEGQLNANGQVFLVNPNGILFGGGARVNVGGLVASTLNIRDADFLAGNYSFTGSGGSIENQGAISAAPGGYLAFIAPKITNSGTISAPQGTVAMGAGERVRLSFAGDRLVGLDVSAETIDTLIENRQAIKAEGGAILLTAAGAEAVTRSVINNAGVLEASSLTSDGGRIVLTAGNDINLGTASTVAVDGKKGGEITVQARSGTLLADGSVSARGAEGAGGTVQLLGNQVGLINAAQADASGMTGGGTVLVGGDFQGKNPDIQNAQRTFVGSGATIKADALDKGDGGKVIVWADGDTRYHGNISAQGGTSSGNGGFVEVSGKENLDFTGGIDVSAAQGIGGRVLLDPQNIVLSTAAAATPPNNPNGTPDIAFNDPPAVGTTNVQISTVTGFSELFLQATNDITVNNPVTMGANNSIRLEANNNITLATGANMAVSGSGNINFKADVDNSGAGTLAMNNATLSSNVGGITLSGASISGTGTINTTGAASANGGNVSITGTSAAGSINLTGAITTTGGTAGAGTAGRNAGNVTINGAGAVTTGAITANGSNGNGAGLNLAGGNGGAIAITGVSGVTTAALGASGGNASTTNGKGGDSGSITINNSGAGNITTTTLTARAGVATGTGAGGNVGSIALTNTAAGGNISTTTINTLGNNNSGGGDVLLSSQGNVTVNGTIGTSAGGNTGLVAGKKAGNITITGVNRSITGAISANGGIASGTNQAGGSAGIVSITGSGTLSTLGINSRTGTATGTGAGGTLGGITLTGSNITTGGLLDTSGRENGDGGNININATGLLTLNGALLSSGGANVTGTTQAGNNAGNITLSGNGITSAAAAIITANGGAGLGTNQAGGNAGQISITGTGTGAIALNTGAAITSSSGAATGTGAGGAVGGITLSGPSITSTGALITTGGANGNGGNVSATTTGSLSVGAITTTGGTAGAGTAGRNAGNVTINGAGAVTTGAITANGSNGNGAGLNLAGGNGGAIAITGVSGVTTAALGASGGNASTTNGKGGDSGSITINNSGAGNITTTTLTARAGVATGTGAGGNVGSIALTNTAAGGNISTTTINTLGNNNSGGGDVLLSSQGNVTVNGTIGTSAGGNTGLVAGKKAGNITITGVNRSITGATSANGGIASGTNQAGGSAGIVSITGSGTLSTLGINSRTGTATGTGAGGTLGGITLTGSNITTGGLLDTSGRENGDGGNININATGLLTLNGALLSSGGANVTGTTQAGNNAGNITLSGNGITSAAAAIITANGGAGLGTNQAGGNAGQISITGTGTGAIALNTGAAITSSSGAATGTGAGGAVGGITLSGPSITSTGALITTGGANGNGGNVSATTTGSLSVGAITTTGGTAGAGTAGRNAGNVTINGAGAVTTGAITANGANGNTNGAGGNGGSVSVTGTANTVSVGAISTIGGNGVGGNSAGGNAGTITLDAGATTPTIALGGNLTATGGDRAGTGTAGSGGQIWLKDAGLLNAATITASAQGGSAGVGTGANVRFDGTINSTGAARALAVNTNAATIFGGAVGGVSALLSLTTNATGTTQINGGAVTTTGAQTYNDAVTLGANTTLSAGAGTTVTAGAAMDLNGFTLGTAGTNLNLTLNGTGVAAGGALTNSSATAASYTGLLTLGSDSSIVTNAGDINITNAGMIGGAFGLTLGGSGNGSISSIIGTGTGTLTKAGTGTWTLGGVNTYTGATNINAGTLAVTANNALGTTAAGTTVASGATLDFRNVAYATTEAVTLNGGTLATSIGTSSFAGPVTLGANSNVDVGGTQLTLSGAIGGAGFGIAKQGNGTLVLSGTNTYTGATNINAGTLAAANSAALGGTGGGTNVDSSARLRIDGVAVGAEPVTLNGPGLFGTGAITSTGTASLAGPVTLAGSAVIAPNVGSILTLSGPVDGAFGLTTGGFGTLNLNGAVGGVTPLAFLTTLATAPSSATGIGASVRTTGNQTYNNPTTLASGVVLQSTAGSLSAPGAVVATAGPVSLRAAGNVVFQNATNDFGTVAINAGANVALRDSNAIDMGVSSIGGSLSLVTGGAVTDSGAISVGGATTINAGAANDITLDNLNDFAGNVSVQSGRNVRLNDINNLTLDVSTFGTLTATAVGTVTLANRLTASGTGDAIVLSGSRFVNSFGASALTATNGRWLVWSSNSNPFGGATPDNRGGLAYDFKQYNATFGVTPVAQPSGNGFLYSLAPTITPGLTGTVSKVYDTTTTAPLTAANFTPTIGVDGDVIAMTATGGYDNPNVAGSPTKLVTATGIAATVTSSIAEGSKPVYGYTLTSTTASANIGEITPAPLTVTSIAAVNTTYGTSAPTGAVSLSGIIGADDVTSTAVIVSPNYSTSNNLSAGSYAQSASNLGGGSAANYNLTAFTTPTNNYVVNKLALSGAAIAGVTTTYATAAAPGAVSFGNVVAGDLVSSTAAIDNPTYSTSGNLSAGSYTQTASAIGGADAANYSFGGITTNPANYVVNKLALSGAAIAGVTTTYATAPAPGAVSFGNVVAGDLVSSTASVNTTTLSSSGNPIVGSYTQSAGTFLGGADAGNYSFAGFTTATANYSITPLALGLNLLGQGSKVYDGTTTITLNGITPTLSGVVSGDVVSPEFNSASGSFVDRNVGMDKPVNFTGITISGADAGNYSLTSGSAASTADITPAPLALQAASGTKVYDGTTVSSGVPGTSGLVVGDTVSGLTQSYQSKNVLGTNGSTLLVNAGYTISDGNGGNNYAVTTNSAAGTITPAPLSITANDAQRAVDTQNPPFSATYAGFVGGETTAVLNGALAFSTPATIASPAGAYPITPFGQTSSNYTIAYVDGVLQIVAGPSVPGVSPVALFDQQTIAAQYSNPEFLMGGLPAILYAEDGDAPPTSASSVRIVRGGLRIAP